MELKQFDYTKRPYTSSKVYDVFPLSRDGFSQYISNDSYTHKYIKNKFDSQILEKLYGDETSMQKTNLQNFYNSNHHNNISQNNQIKNNQNNNEEKKIINSSKKDDLEINKLESLKMNLLPKNTNNNFYKTTNDFSINNNNLKNTLSNLNQNNKISRINEQIYNKKNVDQGQSENEINKNFEDVNTDNKRNCYSSYNRITKKTDISRTQSNGNLYKKTNSSRSNLDNIKNNLNKKHNIKENIRFDTNYASDIDFIKRNQKLFFDFNPKEENIDTQRKKKYDGFESFNVPRLENSQLDITKPSFQYTQRIAKSCIGKRKENNNKIANPFLNQYKDENILEKHNNEKISLKIKEENEKLKKILNTQTNKDFLLRGNMPKISYVALQPKLIIKKFGLGGEGKFLGGKYNPDNFQTGRGDDRNRRNYVGGVYLH